MKRMFFLSAFAMHFMCVYSQLEIPTKFSKIFKSTVSITSDEFETKLDKLEDGQTLQVLVDSIDQYIVTKSDNIIYKVYKKLYDPDNYYYLKTTPNGKILERIYFLPTGRILSFAQEQSGSLIIISYYKKFDLREYISKNLNLKWW